MLTDVQLEGIAAQAHNLARVDRERNAFNFLFASYDEDGLHRMRKVEKLIVDLLGEDWLNSGPAKEAGFHVLRLATQHMPPPAIIFVTEANRFTPTKKFRALPDAEKKRVAERIQRGGNDESHRLAAEGLFAMEDALLACAQTPARVCLYSRVAGSEAPPDVQFFDQREFDGRMKMYGDGELSN